MLFSDHSTLCERVDATRHYDADVIPFRNKGGSREEDGISQWSAIRRLGSGLTTLASFDYNIPETTLAIYHSANRQGDFFAYEVYENSGPAAFQTYQESESLAQRRMVERDKNTQFFEAAGNDRTVQAGRTFKLGGHFSAEPRSMQYDPEPRRGIGNRDYLILSVDHEASNNYQTGASSPSHYENCFTCTRLDIRWRPGPNYNSEPCACPGIQTATVTGPAGADIHTDGLGRVKLQFHWDRLGTYDENSSPWIRVMSSGAGSQFGEIRLPRVKEEVVVVYPDGNMDHPLVIGGVYNGTHMPPWKLPAQASLAGMRSRELGGGRRGNHIVFDDTKEKLQVQLKSDHQCSQLSLGHIARIEDNEGRKDARGEGWELRSDGHGAIRAAKGMLITTESRDCARGSIKDMEETTGRLSAAGEMHQLLAETAQQNGAHEIGNAANPGLTAALAQNASIKGAKSTSQGDFPEFASPHIVLASPAGIASTTAQSTHIASDQNTVITTGNSMSIAVGETLLASVRQTLRLFVQKAGMKLIAAGGDIDVKALSESINILAKLNITQTANRIVISAKEEIVLNGAGSFAKFGAAGIELGTKGNFDVHAAKHEFDAAHGMAAPSLTSDVADVAVKRDLQLEYVDADGNPLQHDPIQAHTWDGQQHDHVLDGEGKAVISNVSRGSFRAEQIKRK